MSEQVSQDEIGRQLAVLGERIDELLMVVPVEKDDGQQTQKAQRRDFRDFSYEIRRSVDCSLDIVHGLKITLPADFRGDVKSWDYHWGDLVDRGVDYVCQRQPQHGGSFEVVERVANDIAALDASDTIAVCLDRYSLIGHQLRPGDNT